MTLVWYVDTTKKGSHPEKWRDDTHWGQYSEQNQIALNMAFEKGTSQLYIMKEKWGCLVLVDLEKLQQYDDEKTVRYMKCHYSTGKLCRSWEDHYFCGACGAELEIRAGDWRLVDSCNPVAYCEGCWIAFLEVQLWNHLSDVVAFRNVVTLIASFC